MWMISVCGLASSPFGLIGASWQPAGKAIPRPDVPASRQSRGPVVPRCDEPARDRPLAGASPEDEGLGCVLDEGMAAQGFGVELDAEAGALRHLQPAVAGLDRPGQEGRLLVAGRELYG